MESRQNRKDLARLGNVLKYACIGTLLVGITSCGSSGGGGGGSSSSSSGSSSRSSSPPPAEVDDTYCAQNKLLVEKLSSNAINKEVVIDGGGSGLAGCGVLVILTGGTDLGMLAGACTLVVAATTWIKVLTMDEATTVRKVLDEHLDPRCATLQK
ncbi:MAG: hypothetical protein AAB552_03260 [Patescibacteria group bacterium]